MNNLLKIAQKIRERQIKRYVDISIETYGKFNPENCPYHRKDETDSCCYCSKKQCPDCKNFYQYTNECPGCLYDSTLKGQALTFRSPKIFKNLSFDFPIDKDQEKIFKKTKTWISQIFEGNIKNLILLGPPGTGKTYTAYTVMKIIRENFLDYSVFLVLMGKFLNEIKDSYKNFKPTQSLYYDAINSWLLVIDEVGNSQNLNHEEDVLYQIINERYEKELPMIIISNFAKRLLEEKVGGRLYSRIMANNAIVLECDLPDYRNWQDKD